MLLRTLIIDVICLDDPVFKLQCYACLLAMKPLWKWLYLYLSQVFFLKPESPVLVRFILKRKRRNATSRNITELLFIKSLRDPWYTHTSVWLGIFSVLRGHIHCFPDISLICCLNFSTCYCGPTDIFIFCIIPSQRAVTVHNSFYCLAQLWP